LGFERAGDLIGPASPRVLGGQVDSRDLIDPGASPIARALIDWHVRHGRHDLPWQSDRTPYRVWVSEIMLQQTQVATVIPYFERFVERFPDVRALADASLDEVLHLWSGLGYYARARNLHRAAICIRDEWAARFPGSFDEIASLSGIGRSTAGAILALSRGERHAILDGNVKRVLCRYFDLDGDPSSAAMIARLWERSEQCTPSEEVATYTQAIMDLGATVCTRHRPACEACPIEQRCRARQAGRENVLPAPRVARSRGARHTFMLVAARCDGRVLLTRRPQRGVWGGLWCLPEFDAAADASAFAVRMLSGVGVQRVREAAPLALAGSPASAAARASPGSPALPVPLPQIRHAFTHFDLTITPLYLECEGPAGVMEAPDAVWYNPGEPQAVGLPAPVRSLLDRLNGAAAESGRPAPQRE
jgi:A/G-specific adenine glycosylase